MSVLTNIALNPNLRIMRRPISDTEFCVVVDNFLANPQALIEYACANAQRFFTPDGGYPGLNLVLPKRLLSDFHRFIRHRMAKEFCFLRGNATMDTGLTMVTFRPEALANFQRICHTDPRAAPGRRKYAALVYLYQDTLLGGTAFYRWKRPDIIDRALALEIDNPAAATALLAQHCGAFRKGPAYMTQSNELAEQLCVIAPRFNRLVFYSGEIPHSGHITAPERLSSDFRSGRLTLNCFVSVQPK